MATILHRFPLQSKLKPIDQAKTCKLCPEAGPQHLKNFNSNPHAVDKKRSTCKACEKKKWAEKEEERKYYTGF